MLLATAVKYVDSEARLPGFGSNPSPSPSILVILGKCLDYVYLNFLICKEEIVVSTSLGSHRVYELTYGKNVGETFLLNPYQLEKKAELHSIMETVHL